MNPADQQNFLDQWIALYNAHPTTDNGALELHHDDIGTIQAFQDAYQPHYHHYGVPVANIIQDREFGKGLMDNVNLCKKELQDALRHACLVVREIARVQTNDLNTTRNQNNTLSAQVQQLTTGNTTLLGQVQQLTTDKNNLTTEKDHLATENSRLRAQLEKLTKKMKKITTKQTQMSHNIVSRSHATMNTSS